MLAKLAALARSIQAAPDAEAAVDALLVGLEQHLDITHAALWVIGDEPDRLLAIASRGFAPSGVGAQLQVGEGPYGLAAAEGGRSVRFVDLSAELRYARSIRRHSEQQGMTLERQIEMPSLAGTKSLVAVPLVVGGELIGVLGAESNQRGAFGPDHEHALLIAGALVAPKLLALSEAEQEDVSTAGQGASGRTLSVRLYLADDSVFVDEEYVIKGVPGAILARMLRAHLKTGRDAFTNKELRKDATLRLPEFKDNLESRLILLRRRLDEKGCGIRLERTGRGCLRLLVDGTLDIVES